MNRINQSVRRIQGNGDFAFVMRVSRKRAIALIVGVCVVAFVLVQAIWRPFGPHGPMQTAVVTLDVLHPDAIIDTPALSRLPADVLRVPLLHDVLTQDFVDYYQSSPERLSAEGTLRRLAFEHELDWSDQLIRRVFDEPAHILMWRSRDGRLGHWAMSMHRNGLARLLQGLANIAANDTQLKQVASLDDTPVYALRLAVGHTLLFIARGDRLLVMSDPGVLLDQAGVPMRDRADVFGEMLDKGRDDSAEAYRLTVSGDAPQGHQLVVSANYLSFGYQFFFPGIKALRFDFDAGGAGPAQWHTSALINPSQLPQHWDSGELWHAVPAGAAACVSLPVDWSEASGLLGQPALAGEAAKAIGAQLTGPIGVCWYAQSRLFSPLFVARVKAMDSASVQAFSQSLGQVFEQVIGAYEARAPEASQNGGYRRLPMSISHPSPNTTVWQRPVSALEGTARAAGTPFAAQLSTRRYFPVTLALGKGYLLFSPDAQLVDNALAVLSQRYPATADTLVPARLSNTILTLTPAAAATLVEQEAAIALPASREAVLRNAAQAYLVPKLTALAGYPPVSLSLPAALPSRTAWVPVAWHYEHAIQGADAPTGSMLATPDGGVN